MTGKAAAMNDKEVAGELRKGHRCNNQIKVMAVAMAAAAAALKGSDGQWLGGRQHDKREGADNMRQGMDNTVRERECMTQGNQAVDDTKEEEMRGGGVVNAGGRQLQAATADNRACHW
jgi:hypothetical protein